MEVHVGLDGRFKRREVDVAATSGDALWRGAAETHPEMIAAAVSQWRDSLVKLSLEMGSTMPWLARGRWRSGRPWW